MKYWCFGAGKIGQKFSDWKLSDNILGFIDKYADSINYINGKIPVYTYNKFKQIFSKKSEKIIITVNKDIYIDEILCLLGKNNLLDSVVGIYNGEDIVKIHNIWQNLSMSQYGEDMALRHLMAGILPAKGTYVDVGAYHPFRYSNTFFLYQNGWHGINIDANSNVIKLFDLFRKDDKNIVSGVSDKKEKHLIYYTFEEGGYNTFDFNLAENRKSKSKYLGSTLVPVESLNNILSNENIDSIDYLNIDVEGFDNKIISGFDFEKYKPLCVSVESDFQTIEEYLQGYTHKVFTANGYSLFGYYYPTVIYVKGKYYDNGLAFIKR